MHIEMQHNTAQRIIMTVFALTHKVPLLYYSSGSSCCHTVKATKSLQALKSCHRDSSQACFTMFAYMFAGWCSE